MPASPTFAITATLLLAGTLLTSACGRDHDDSTPTTTPTVTVTPVISRAVSQSEQFIASTTAIHSVTLRARVTGVLQQRLFTEGAMVARDELLYVIQPEEYQAEFKQSQADLASAEAALTSIQSDLRRYQTLRHKQDVSAQKLDAYIANEKEAAALQQSRQAALSEAQLKLDYTQIHSPLAGRIGETQVNVGNLVGPDGNTELATIVQLDPIYVTFRPGGAAMDTIIRRQRRQALPVSVKLPHRDDRYQGHIDFIDNQVDPATGTIKMRAVIANPQGTLLPGEFARIVITTGDASDAMLVPQAALVENQGGFLLYRVGDDNKVQVRSVTAGQTLGELRVVSSADGSAKEPPLQVGDQVIVSGVQQVHAGMTVNTRSAGHQASLTRPTGPASPAK